MCRKLLFLVLVLTFGLSSSVYAATIIWVSDNKNPSGGGTADQGWVDLLRAAGYTVDYRGEGGSGDAGYRYWRELDAAKIAELNAADLIIVSRDISSGGYDDGQEPTQWSSVTAPLILQIAHLVRQPDWNWLNSSSTSSTTANMSAVLPSHPVFAGVTLDASKQVNILASGDADVGAVTDAGNGTVIGTRADTGAVWIAEWEPGVEFYAGAGLYTGGPRMWFAGGDSNPDGGYNFNAEGEKLFLNAVRYMLGETGGPGQASDPNPADEATDLPRDVVLSWTPGEYAPPINGHKVYLSENFSDVNDGVGGIAADANSFAPDQRLDFGTTYYWRIDEVNGAPDFTVYQGDTWSFTTEPVGYAIDGANITATASSAHQADMGPENTINGSGLDANDLHSNKPADMWLSGNEPLGAWIEYEFDKVYKLHQMWVWNSNQSVESLVGFGVKDVTIEYSTNGTDYTTLGTTHEFAQATGAPDYAHNTTTDLGGVAAKYVKLTAQSNRGFLAQYGLSEIRFLYIPARAREASPDSGATDVDVDVTLGFRAGREAAEHDVYFSSDEQAVMDGTVPVATVTEASHGPLSLDLSMTYYWKINEVNMAESPSMLEGDLWNFTTREFLVVDDFESYNDLNPEDPESNRIFLVWLDGYGVDTNGSIVGYDAPPFAEQTIVHGGEQSMPLSYDNSGTARYSEAERTLSPPQDWTKHGVKALSLWFHGDPNNAAEQIYVKVNGSNVVYDGDVADIQQTSWQQWNVDLASFAVDLRNVTKLAVGVGDATSMTPGGSGVLYVDDIGLYPSRCIPSLRKPQGDINNDCVVNYLDLELMAGDWLLSDSSLATATPNPAGLIGHWPFDGNLNDISANGNHGNPDGSPSYVVGQAGQAISLDGATQGVAVSGFGQIQGVSELTIAMWAKPNVVDDNPDEHTMWFTDQTGGNGRIRCRLNGGNWQWQHGDGNANITITSPATAGVWTHFAGVRSDNDKIELFVDGVSMGTEPFVLHGPHSDQSSIGAERRSPTDIRDRFDGLIDDVRVYGRALSAAEVAYLADESPGDGELYVPVPPLAELYDAEPLKSRKINFKDYAILADSWLEEQLWPQP